MIDPDALFDALHAEDVKHVIIGGFAALMQGGSRVTRDIDIAYEATTHNMERLCRALNRFEPRRVFMGEVSAPFELTPAYLKANPQAQLLTSVGPIDVLSKIDGFNSYASLTTYAQSITVGERKLSVLSREGLLKAKRALKRAKDIEDIRELEALEEIDLIDAAGQSDSVKSAGPPSAPPS